MLVKINNSLAVNTDDISYITTEYTGIDRRYKMTVIVKKDGNKIQTPTDSEIVINLLCEVDE